MYVVLGRLMREGESDRDGAGGCKVLTVLRGSLSCAPGVPSCWPGARQRTYTDKFKVLGSLHAFPSLWNFQLLISHSLKPTTWQPLSVLADPGPQFTEHVDPVRSSGASWRCRLPGPCPRGLRDQIFLKPHRTGRHTGWEALP